MLTYKLTNKVKPPESRIRTPSYPFAEMEIGDSFFVPRDHLKSKLQLKQSCYYFSRNSMERMGKLYKFRISDEKGGYRVFRIKPR